jgi:hypothetical protein
MDGKLKGPKRLSIVVCTAMIPAGQLRARSTGDQTKVS